MPISSLAQTQQIVQQLGALQTRGNDLQQQITTGLKSQSYAGLAPQAGGRPSALRIGCPHRPGPGPWHAGR